MQVMPYEHGINNVRSYKQYRKGKGATSRLFRTSMETIPYGHRSNQYRTNIKGIP